MKAFKYKITLDISNGGEYDEATIKDIVLCENDTLSNAQVEENLIRLLKLNRSDVMSVKLKPILIIK